MSSGTGDETTPSIVVAGEATAEELAALVAVLSAASGGESAAPERSASTWATHAVALRHPVNHGPGAWRSSLRPDGRRSA
jgi:hypothetical protein